MMKTIDERRAEYEWNGAPRGICEAILYEGLPNMERVCGQFYEETAYHIGKDLPAVFGGGDDQHMFKTTLKKASDD